MTTQEALQILNDRTGKYSAEQKAEAGKVMDEVNKGSFARLKHTGGRGERRAG